MPLSYRLWKALQQPVESPFDLHNQPSSNKRKHDPTRTMVLILLTFMFGFHLLILVGLVVYVPVIQLLATRLAISVSRKISEEIIQGRHPVTAVTPPGSFGINWLLMWHSARENSQRRRSYWIRIITFGAFINFSFIITAPFLFEPAFIVRENTSGFIIIAPLFIYIDWIQSFAAASLIGMLTPIIARKQSNAPLIAAVFYLGFQAASFLIVLVPLLVILFSLTEPNPANLILAMIVATPLQTILREIVIWRLWRWSAFRLNASASELKNLLQMRNPS